MKKLLFFMAAFLFFGCTTIQENINMVNCKYSLLQVEPTDFNFTSINMDVIMGITNVSKTAAAAVKRFDGDLIVNDINIAKLAFKDVKVEPNSTLNKKIPLEIPIASLGKLAGQISMRSASVVYKVNGTMYFSTPLGEVGIPVTLYKDNLK